VEHLNQVEVRSQVEVGQIRTSQSSGSAEMVEVRDQSEQVEHQRSVEVQRSRSSRGRI
jgi:hypothetical protein